MNTDLIEKLEALAEDAKQAAEYYADAARTAHSSVERALYADAQAAHSEKRDLLRATITAIQQAQEDTRRLDWLEKHEKGVYTLTKTYVGGPNSELYFEGWAVVCSTDASKTLRDAIDSAISSTAKEGA